MDDDHCEETEHGDSYPDSGEHSAGCPSDESPFGKHGGLILGLIFLVIGIGSLVQRCQWFGH